jgi:chromate transporter
MVPPRLSRMTALYLRVSNLTFGGGDPTMAALYTELVERRRWLSAETYGLVYALARITPGTNMLAFCAGTAWAVLGWRAAVLAVVAATVPASIVVVLLTVGYGALQHHPRAMAAIGGTLAAAVGMMATSAWQLLASHLTAHGWRRALRAIALAGAALLLAVAGIAPIGILALAGAVGFAWPSPDER